MKKNYCGTTGFRTLPLFPQSQVLTHPKSYPPDTGLSIGRKNNLKISGLPYSAGEPGAGGQP